MDDHFSSPAISFLSVARASRSDARDVAFWPSEEEEKKAKRQRRASTDRASPAAAGLPNPRVITSCPDSTGYSGILFFGLASGLPRQNNVKFSARQ
jgi:hypothetical protein